MAASLHEPIIHDDQLNVDVDGIENKAYEESLGEVEHDLEPAVQFETRDIKLLDRLATCVLGISEVETITLTWEEINVWTHHESHNSNMGYQRKRTHAKHVLRNVTGYVEGGTLLAIMGASGSGKSTLLNVLTHRHTSAFTLHGTVKINGHFLGPGIRSISAYVQQDDLFLGMLTVREHLKFQAILRMDEKLSYQQRMEKVEEALIEFSLKSCENTLIGIPGRMKGISGGEKKRLAFACEVLTDPKLMFCDEPTSGLDSFMAQNVVMVMKDMASKGRTILCTIHQPASELYAMFDRLLLMAEGRVAYLGSTKALHGYFDSLNLRCPPKFNPADYYVDILAVIPAKETQCRDKIEKICDAFEISAERGVIKQVIKEDNENKQLYDFGELLVYGSPYKASWLKQLMALTQRSFTTEIRDPQAVKITVIQTIVNAVMVGMMYLQQKLNQEAIQNISGFVLLLVMMTLMQNMFSILLVFCEESLIIMREHFNGDYRLDTYYLSKMFAQLPFFATVPLIYVVIDYFMIGLYSSAFHFFTCVGVIILTSDAAVAISYMLSYCSSNYEVVMAAGSPVMLLLFVVGGFNLNLESIPVYFKWIEYFSIIKHGNEALNINQWKDIKEIACLRNDTTCIRDGKQVLQFFGYDQDNFAKDIGLLLALMVLYRLIGYLILLFRAKKAA